MNPIEKFKKEVSNNIKSLSDDKDLKALSNIWIREISPHKYAYNFSWMGRPAIQIPQDMVAMQEIIWEVQPDLIIETGIAHGGSLIMNASYLAMLDYCDATKQCKTLDPQKPCRKVLGVDIDIRKHNKEEIEKHPMFSRIDMIEGSSITQETIDKVYSYAENYSKPLIILDSNHTHDHVLSELFAYAPLVGKESYMIVMDTVIEDMPESFFPDRPWGVKNNPKTAVYDFLEAAKDSRIKNKEGEAINFKIDKDLEAKIQITVAPDGYLKRTL